MTNNVVANLAIKTSKELRRKIMGIQGLSGTNWMTALLCIEHFGLDLRRDNIIRQSTGEQVVRSQTMAFSKSSNSVDGQSNPKVGRLNGDEIINMRFADRLRRAMNPGK
jgi:hypothetical protein